MLCVDIRVVPVLAVKYMYIQLNLSWLAKYISMYIDSLAYQ